MSLCKIQVMLRVKSKQESKKLQIFVGEVRRLFQCQGFPNIPRTLISVMWRCLTSEACQSKERSFCPYHVLRSQQMCVYSRGCGVEYGWKRSSDRLQYLKVHYQFKFALKKWGFAQSLASATRAIIIIAGVQLWMELTDSKTEWINKSVIISPPYNSFITFNTTCSSPLRLPC